MKNVLKVNPESAQAAYNIGVMLAERKPEESMKYIKMAVKLAPAEPKYQYSLAFYLLKAEKKTQAVSILEKLVDNHPDYADSWFLLGSIYEETDKEKAKKLYEQALKYEGLNDEARQAITQKLTEFQ